MRSNGNINNTPLLESHLSGGVKDYKDAWKLIQKKSFLFRKKIKVSVVLWAKSEVPSPRAEVPVNPTPVLGPLPPDRPSSRLQDGVHAESISWSLGPSQSQELEVPGHRGQSPRSP